jgi:hypothetical protein
MSANGSKGDMPGLYCQVRFAPENRHRLRRAAGQLWARTGLMHRSKSRPIAWPVDAGEHGLFGQPRFPKTLDHQLRGFW